MNKVFLVGRLTGAPEARQTPNGVSVTQFNIAVDRRYKRDETDFFTIVTWRGLADNCSKYLVKGQQVAVEGEIHVRSYDAKDGTKRIAVEIQADNVEFLAKPGAGGSSGGNSASGNYKGAAAPSESGDELFASEMTGVLVEDDGLPF